MKITKSTKVYTCCAKYFALNKAMADSKTTINCPICGKPLTNKVTTPYIYIVTKS